jgi:nitrogen regulatory protein P-II 1
MKFSKVTAIIQPDRLNKVEQKLHSINVPGMSISQVKGYGEYADFYTTDWMVTHTRIEVFVSTEQAESVAEAIMSAAYTGCEGDGIICISPVESVYHIRSRKKCDTKPC